MVSANVSNSTLGNPSSSMVTLVLLILPVATVGLSVILNMAVLSPSAAKSFGATSVNL